MHCSHYDSKTKSNWECNVTNSQACNIYPDKHEKGEVKNKRIDAEGKNGAQDDDTLMLLL